MHTLKKYYHRSPCRISWMEKWKHLWSMCTSLHVLPVLLWFLNYSIMWNTCKVRETIFEYLWLLKPYRHAQTGIPLLSIFGFVYCVSILTCDTHDGDLHQDLMLCPYTHVRMSWEHPKQKCYLYHPSGKHTKFLNYRLLT